MEITCDVVGELCLDEDRERPIVDQRNLHHRAELAGLHVQAARTQVGHDGLDEGLGRRPLRVSPYSVNCEITRIGAPTSSADRSSSRMRSSAILRATVATWAGPSPR